MPAALRNHSKREALNLRIKAEERDLIDRAAKVQHKNRTDFILDAARLVAEEALLDQRLIQVDAKTHAEFIARLDAPLSQADVNARLRKTMATPAPWDKQ